MALEVPRRLRRGRYTDIDEWLDSAVALIDLLCRARGCDDLGDVSLLDVGCGTKFTKAFLDLGLPIRRYVGVDVNPEIVDFLRRSVDDPRFAFEHLPARNEYYNPDGRPLSSFERLPCDDETFDLISLFSVFTHLPPRDYAPMLHLLRANARPGTTLVYSIFIHSAGSLTLEQFDAALATTETHLRRLAHDDERARGSDPHLTPEARRGFVREAMLRLLGALDPADLPRGREAMVDLIARADSPIGLLADAYAEVPDDPSYLERRPETPLLHSSYAERLARGLVEGTGWEVVSLNPPEPPHVQHYFVCRAV